MKRRAVTAETGVLLDVKNPKFSRLSLINFAHLGQIARSHRTTIAEKSWQSRRDPPNVAYRVRNSPKWRIVGFPEVSTQFPECSGMPVNRPELDFYTKIICPCAA